MTRRMPLPKITECVDDRKLEGGVSRGQLLRACYPFVVIAALCLAHIQLQFARVDMLVQEGQLQGQHRILLRRAAMLERQSQAVDMELLRQRGKADFQMVEVENPTQELLAVIPAELQRKYQEPLAAKDDVLLSKLQAQEKPSGLKEILFSLLESGRAVASVSTGRP